MKYVWSRLPSGCHFKIQILFNFKFLRLNIIWISLRNNTFFSISAFLAQQKKMLSRIMKSVNGENHRKKKRKKKNRNHKALPGADRVDIARIRTPPFALSFCHQALSTSLAWFTIVHVWEIEGIGPLIRTPPASTTTTFGDNDNWLAGWKMDRKFRIRKKTPASWRRFSG